VTSGLSRRRAGFTSTTTRAGVGQQQIIRNVSAGDTADLGAKQERLSHDPTTDRSKSADNNTANSSRDS